MTRKYNLKRRAELQQETRQKIIEAAMVLHGKQGLARTTISQIAEVAGVGRQTVYRHFPDEIAMVRACSGQYFERHQLPDPDPWLKISDPIERFRYGLGQSYAYHRLTEPMLSRILPEASEHPAVQPYHDHWKRAADALSSAFLVSSDRRTPLKAAIRHAIVFPTWVSLVRDQGLTDDQAIDLWRPLLPKSRKT